MKKTELQPNFILVEGEKVIAHLAVNQDKLGVRGKYGFVHLFMIWNTSKMTKVQKDFAEYIGQEQWSSRRDYARIFPAIVAEYIKNKPKLKNMQLYTLPTLIPHP